MVAHLRRCSAQRGRVIGAGTGACPYRQDDAGTAGALETIATAPCVFRVGRMYPATRAGRTRFMGQVPGRRRLVAARRQKVGFDANLGQKAEVVGVRLERLRQLSETTS